MQKIRLHFYPQEPWVPGLWVQKDSVPCLIPRQPVHPVRQGICEDPVMPNA